MRSYLLKKSLMLSLSTGGAFGSAQLVKKQKQKKQKNKNKTKQNKTKQKQNTHTHTHTHTKEWTRLYDCLVHYSSDFYDHINKSSAMH